MDSVTTGLEAQNCTGGIVFTHNEVKNVLGPFPRGQMAQYAKCSGAGNKINYNKIENIFGQSDPEDAINTYTSSGTAVSPIEIIGNWIRGGGPSTSGGGILLGDNGTSYQIARDNILVNPGQYGISMPRPATTLRRVETSSTGPTRMEPGTASKTTVTAAP